jgi:ABC-2 family transporter protein
VKESSFKVLEISIQIFTFNFRLVVLIFSLTVVNLVLFSWSVGGDPKGLKIGIVNHEIENYADCFDDSYSTVIYREEEYTCDLQKISCRFLKKLTNDFAIMKFYKNFDDAFKDVQTAELIGFIEFKSNFSKSQQYFLSKEVEIDENILDDREIKIYLDETNSQFSVFLKRNFYDIFKNYSVELMKECKYPLKLESTGINFMNPISFGDGIKKSIAPTFIIVLLFLISSYATVMLFIEDRQSGIWNRSILLGV